MSRITSNLFLGMTLAVSGRLFVASAQTSETLNKKQAQVLETTAKSSDDHRKLAGFYREQAHLQRVESRKHALEAAAYKRNPTGDEVKHPLAYRTEAHCRFLADKYETAAMQSEERAASHERMAGMPLKVLSPVRTAQGSTNCCAGDSCCKDGGSCCAAGPSCCSGSSCARNRKGT